RPGGRTETTGERSRPVTPVATEQPRPRFLLYVPNAELNAFHSRSPWVMFPRSFEELGFDSTLVCGRFTGQRPPGVRVIETGLVVQDPRKGGALRSLMEPLFAFREVVHRSPHIVIVGPLRSSLLTLLPLVLLYRTF